MSNLGKNLLFLLWQKKLPKKQWVDTVACWAGSGVTQARAKELLEGSSPTPTEIQNLAVRLDHQEDDLLYTDLLALSNINILQTNLIFLIDQLKPANKKQGDLAEALEVKQEAISRWKKGKQKPPKERIQKLIDFFGLPTDYDLENEALFLSLDPIGIIEQKNWLHQQINCLSERTLRELFPAFKRLFEKP